MKTENELASNRICLTRRLHCGTMLTTLRRQPLRSISQHQTYSGVDSHIVASKVDSHCPKELSNRESTLTKQAMESILAQRVTATHSSPACLTAIHFFEIHLHVSSIFKLLKLNQFCISLMESFHISGIALDNSFNLWNSFTNINFFLEFFHLLAISDDFMLPSTAFQYLNRDSFSDFQFLSIQKI